MSTTARASKLVARLCDASNESDSFYLLLLHYTVCSQRQKADQYMGSQTQAKLAGGCAKMGSAENPCLEQGNFDFVFFKHLCVLKLSILRKCRTFETSERYINYTRRVESSYVDFVSMYVKTELEAQFLVVVVLARIARIARICTTWNYRVQVHLSFRALL